MDLLRQQTPEAQFGFSLLRSSTNSSSMPQKTNLKTIFADGLASILSLVEFCKLHKLKSFDVSSDLIESSSGKILNEHYTRIIITTKLNYFVF